MTPAGVDKKTLDGIDWDFFTNLGEKLKQGKFNFATSRKVNIPKAPNEWGGRLECRPPRDKIIQKALALVLETIFEPNFLDSSFGFRAKRGVHMGLKELYLKGGNYS